jgi:hypothetical protein
LFLFEHAENGEQEPMDKKRTMEQGEKEGLEE